MYGLLPEDEAAAWVKANKGGKGAAAGTPVKRPVSGAKRPAGACGLLRPSTAADAAPGRNTDAVQRRQECEVVSGASCRVALMTCVCVWFLLRLFLPPAAGKAPAAKRAATGSGSKLKPKTAAAAAKKGGPTPKRKGKGEKAGWDSDGDEDESSAESSEEEEASSDDDLPLAKRRGAAKAK